MSDDDKLDVIWGAEEIGKAIGKNVRQTFWLLENGALPARKIRGQWCADRSALRAYFRSQVA